MKTKKTNNRKNETIGGLLADAMFAPLPKILAQLAGINFGAITAVMAGAATQEERLANFGLVWRMIRPGLVWVSSILPGQLGAAFKLLVIVGDALVIPAAGADFKAGKDV
jgi:hypothetical protein